MFILALLSLVAVYQQPAPLPLDHAAVYQEPLPLAADHFLVDWEPHPLPLDPGWVWPEPPKPSPEPQKATQDAPKPPEPTPPPASGMGNGNVEQWRGLVAAYFPADQVDRALRVMACESGGNPNAYNPSGASGLMQVLASWADNFGYTPQQLFDPAINLHVASILYYDGGWGHWVCKG